MKPSRIFVFASSPICSSDFWELHCRKTTVVSLAVDILNKVPSDYRRAFLNIFRIYPSLNLVMLSDWWFTCAEAR